MICNYLDGTPKSRSCTGDDGVTLPATAACSSSAGSSSIYGGLHYLLASSGKTVNTVLHSNFACGTFVPPAPAASPKKKGGKVSSKK
jgi:hypothetical protein